MSLRLLAIPWSTNVERVMLALGHKGIDAELVPCDPRNRSAVVELSGQPLVPVLDDDGTVVTDSSTIIEYLEQRFPQRPLFPAATAERALMRIFVNWFDRVWKAAPNAIEAELMKPRPDLHEVERLSEQMQESLQLFGQLLDGRDYLAGDGFSAADCCAYPFLKYCSAAPDRDDDELFHRVLHEHLRPGGERLRAWVARVDAHPRRPAAESD